MVMVGHVVCRRWNPLVPNMHLGKKSTNNQGGTTKGFGGQMPSLKIGKRIIYKGI